jgi:hypothetical protein
MSSIKVAVPSQTEHTTDHVPVIAIPTSLLLPTSTAPHDIHIHLGRTDTLSIPFAAPTAAQMNTINRLGGVILPFQRNGVHAPLSFMAEDEDTSGRGYAQGAQGSPTPSEEEGQGKA